MKNPAILIVREGRLSDPYVKKQWFGHAVDIIEAADLREAVKLSRREIPDLIIIISESKDCGNGLGSVKTLRGLYPCLPIILVTRYSSENKAVAALRAGVSDYFKVPFGREEFLGQVRKYLYGRSNDTAFHSRNSHLFFRHDAIMVGESKPMREVKAYLHKVAATDSTVLITGETGTGKELAAKLIYHNSPRRRQPFVCVNCAALPENLVESELFGFDRGAFTGAVAPQKGKFALARRGTVFLDEIGDMSLCAQAKILRTIEKKEIFPLGAKRSLPVDVRVIAATNQELQQMVVCGRFREDLYYRLNVARVDLPPLRNRKEDIPGLLSHFIEMFNRRYGRHVAGFARNSMGLLLGYEWPGNVRELKNMVEASFINLPSRRLAWIDLPLRFRQRLKETEKQSKGERHRVVAALLQTNWNKSTAARQLNWSRMTLYRKMAKYHIIENRTPPR